MAEPLEVPGVGAFTEEVEGEWVSELHPIPALRGHRCRFVLQGLARDRHRDDYFQAARTFLAAGAGPLIQATPFVHRYCRDTLRSLGDAAPALAIERPADVWNHVRLGTELLVSRNRGSGRDVFVSLECKCDWEPERGLQLVFENGREIAKVGPFDGHLTNEGAYADRGLRGVVYVDPRDQARKRRDDDARGSEADETFRPRWRWPHFVVTFLLAGLLTFFDAHMPFFRDLGAHVVETLVVATVVGVVCGFFGDPALERFLRSQRW